MSYSQERFQNHAVHSSIKSLEDAITNSPLEFPDTGPERDSFERLKKLIRYTNSTMKALDPELTSNQALKNLETRINGLCQSVNNFRSDKNWKAIQDNCDELLNHFYLLPRREPKSAERELNQAIKSFDKESREVITDFLNSRKIQEQEFENIQQIIDRFKSDLAKHSTEFEQQKGRLDQVISREQNRFNESEQMRTSEHASNVTKRNNQFNQLIETQEQEYETLTNQLQDKVEEQGELLDEKADKILETLENHQTRAKEIVGLIGTSGLTRHFQKVANTEWVSAEVLRFCGLAVMFVMIFLVSKVITDVKSAEFNLEYALFRVGVAFALIWPASICISESRRHRKEQTRNRRIELELLSIDPYLERLDPNKKKVIIEKFADRYFGREDTEEFSKKMESVIDDRLKQIEKVITAVSKTVSR